MRPSAGGPGDRRQSQVHGGMGQHLPRVSTAGSAGFVETLVAPPYAGPELAKIAVPLAMEVNDLFPMADALHILDFAELEGGTIKLTAAGRVFGESRGDERKRLFREHLLRFVPLAAHIHQVLEEREGHAAPRARFEFELQDHLTEEDARITLWAVTDWGRYAELFTYDDRARTFGLAHFPA